MVNHFIKSVLSNKSNSILNVLKFIPVFYLAYVLILTRSKIGSLLTTLMTNKCYIWRTIRGEFKSMLWIKNQRKKSERFANWEYHYRYIELGEIRTHHDWDYYSIVISDHDDVIKWKHFPRYWSFVRGIHRSPMNSRHKGQWCGALMFSLICGWINGWVNNRDIGDLKRHRTHYDVIVMIFTFNSPHLPVISMPCS